ncbi:hypothetical protein ACH5RR_013586 [Cinchona calisaya]|uniref:Uncharacterized protein n=1 Tax=Cinchona calisaya TaxID=153742 RepID=A0ABD3A1U7_9GENT
MGWRGKGAEARENGGRGPEMRENGGKEGGSRGGAWQGRERRCRGKVEASERGGEEMDRGAEERGKREIHQRKANPAASVSKNMSRVSNPPSCRNFAPTCRIRHIPHRPGDGVLREYANTKEEPGAR